MGGATFLIGCVPSYETIGFLAPILVLLLRLLQGLALGGEYGGAATYVAEHAPADQRGYWTAWIQTTATLGLFISLMVIMLTKNSMSKEAFTDWGWRVPFWVSILMIGVSYLIRKNMHESPLFAKAKASGKTSTNPLKESFGNKYNFKFVLLALLGATMGQGVVWYTGHYYAMNFLKIECFVDADAVEHIMTFAFLLGTPFFVFFGWLSDKVGRKPIMMAGLLIAILSYFSIYRSMYKTATNEHRTEIVEKTSKVESMAANPKVAGDSIKTVKVHQEFADGAVMNKTMVSDVFADASKPVAKPKITGGTTVPSADYWWLVFLVFIQVIFVTMVYGPIAAFLVEMFPTKIRYTSMSLPYHVGNGIFGGLMPAVATYLTTSSRATGASEWYLQGIWYPIIIASICFVIGMLYLDSTDKRVDD